MNKSVYLYELDSVRNSKEEIQYAQERMFREIILNGNQVILTMNQLADSRAFLAAIENENTFEPFFELCQMGVIRISQYGSLRTPSQYFQGKIEEFLKKAEKTESEKSAFIYSGVPVAHDDAVMLRQLLKALRYSDPECLRELSGYNEENYSEEKIEYLIRYVKTLLALSVNAFSLNPPKKVKQKKLTEYLHEIAYPLTDQGTVEILKGVEKDLSLQNRQEYRSDWHIYLHENEKGKKAEYAEAVLDLCYNLTTEDSIYGISKHYDPKDIESCREWFKSKLKDYWEKDIAPIHVFPAKDSTTWELYQGKLPDWSCAIRILQMKNVQETLELKPALENEELQTGSRYEVGMEKELKEWDKSIHKGIKRNIIDALIGVVIFVGIELGMNYLQDIVSVEGELSLAVTIGLAVLQVIAFGILSSWISGMISHWWTSCDILDSIEELTRTWADLKIVRKCRERLKVEKG